jgi:replicative DNA helicase
MSQFINAEAEQQIIAGMLKQPARIIPSIKAEMITENHFEDTRSKTLFSIVMELHAAGRELHIKNLSRQPEITCLEDSTITTDISDIKTKFISIEAWKSYIPLLKKNYATREAYRHATEALLMIEGGSAPDKIASHLSGAAQNISAIVESSSSWKTSQQSSQEFIEMMQRIHTAGNTSGESSGVESIDRETGGLAPEDLWVVAAPSSCGKTMLMIQIANTFHLNEKNVLIFSFETNAAKIFTRVLANRLDVDSKAILGKGDVKLTKDEVIKIKNETEKIKDSGTLTICDNFDLTLESMMGIASQLKETGVDIDLIAVDYIQLVGVSDKEGLSREQQVSLVSRSLKKMAKEHHCPVISASQLNDDGKVRESRAIMQDADVLLKIDPEKGCIHVGKNRDGERGNELPLYMLGCYQRFVYNQYYEK